MVPTLRDLCLLPAFNWYLLGLQLGVSADELDVIERNYPRDNHMCKAKMFGVWLRVDTSASYRKLARALAAVGKRNIAEAVCTARGIPLTVLDDSLVFQAPTAPTIVSVEATSSTSISVQWNASKKDGGSSITGYVVEYCPAFDPSPFETWVVERDVLSTTLNDLTPSTEYEVRVRGENAVGRSDPSSSRWTKTKPDTELQRALKPYTVKAKPTGEALGSGTYGRVIELSSAGEIVAGKVFNTLSNIDQQTLTNKWLRELCLMAQVHHPNIVKCKGVCFLENETMPVLLMERMMSSLHTYLLKPTNMNIELERKLSILLDVASGLFYLHSHKPAIIHRDLTGTNVLLDTEVRAKISDFGNARLMDLDPEATPGVFTSLPGTPDYMPPEAQGDSPKCGPSLDVFSFGHLSLFTIIQSLVHPLLPSTYYDAQRKFCPRSEVKRRKQYLDKAEQLLKGKHAVVVLIKECLHNDSALRPPTAELERKLEDMLKRSTQVTSDEYVGLRYEPKMTDLMNEIAMELPDKWQDIGRGLGLEERELKQIKLQEQTINNIFSSVFTQWRNGKKSPYTWEQVLKVLYQPAVGGIRVADELKEKYRVT